MQSVRWMSYPWQRMLGGADALPNPNGQIWSAGGILLVPDSSVVEVLGNNGWTRLPGGDCQIPLPEKKECIRISVTCGTEKSEFKLEPPDSMASLLDHQSCRTLSLYQIVLSWASFFDECLVDDRGDERQVETLSWGDIDEKLKNAMDNPDEPQMSLIVRIAESLSKTIEDFDRGIRRVLTRDRRMMPADKAEEFDAVSIDWYIRQPGFSAAEKAAYNQQRLKAVARKEFVDTLENRVLKDFLQRCTVEADGYRLLCTEKQKQSRRARMVQKFGLLCRTLLSSPAFESIASIHSIVQPNYVLQGDSRYRKVWRFYKLLLRKQRVADFFWAWQVRLWGDIVAVALNVLLWRMTGESTANLWSLEPIAQSGPQLSFEQHDGRRLSDDSDAGPWLLRRRGDVLSSGQVVEVVSSARMEEFLGRSGDWVGAQEGVRAIRGATVLFFTPLQSNRRHSVLVVWPLHSAADNKIDQDGILKTMNQALRFIARRSTSPLSVYGLVVASGHSSADISEEFDPVMAFGFGSHPAQWAKNLSELETWFSELFEEVLR